MYEYENKFEILHYLLKDREHLFIEISLSNFIDALINANNVADYLEVSAYRLRKLTKVVFPEKPEKGKLINYILGSVGLKLCNKCSKYLTIDNYYENKSTTDGLNNHCKSCHYGQTAKTQPSRSALYRANKIQATPKWADLDKIKRIYNNCPTGFHVDHIMPLNGVGFCGLHVEYNLQYLTAKENCSKGNRLP